jgi:hypothetical protein
MKKNSNRILDTKYFYAELKYKSEFIFDYCQSLLVNKDLKWIEYTGFDTFSLPNELISKEPLLRKINKQFKIEHIGIAKLEPHQTYVWHTDGIRGVSINMLVSSYEYKSHCFFGLPVKNIDNTMDLYELQYNPKTFYLFNNQVPHTVINFDKIRYMFSLIFMEKRDSLKYSDLYKWIRNENLLIDH